MKSLMLSAAVCLTALVGSVKGSVTMVWSSQLDLPTFQSDGVTPFTDSFTVELGIFTSPFLPDGTNYANYEANWYSFGSTPFNSAAGYYSQSVTLDDNIMAPAGSQAYVWIKGPDHADGRKEWLLMTDDSSDGDLSDDWLVPDTTGSDQTTRPVFYDLRLDAIPSTVIFGATAEGNGGGNGVAPPAGFAISSHSAVIPEPSSLGLAGLVALGFFGRRRR